MPVKIALAAIVALGVLAGAPEARAGGDSKAGRELAIKYCTRCHVVGDANPYGGIDSTPSFQLLARRADWRARFSSFFERRPHPVFVRVPNVPRWTDLPSHVVEFQITLKDVDDIVAFVETLQPK